MNNTNQHVDPAVQNEDMSPAEQENETIESKKRVFRHRLKNSEKMTEAEIEALYQEHNSLLAQIKDLFKKIKARSLGPNEVFNHYEHHTYRFAQLRARTPALQDLNLLSTEAIDNWSNILEHDRKAREAKWELYRRCKEEAEFGTLCKKVFAFTRKHLVLSKSGAGVFRSLERIAYLDSTIFVLSNYPFTAINNPIVKMANQAFHELQDTYSTASAYNEGDPTTWHNHLNRLVAVRKAHLDVIPTFQDEWRAYLDATAEYKFHRDAAKVKNHTINIDTISDSAMGHVMQMSGAQTKALKAYHKILGLARADLARMKEVETLARKILDLRGRRKVFRVEELQRAEAVVLWVQKTRTSIFNVLGEIKKNSI
ncbi:hypothetical protein M438DRAFT_337638 [Aureobasidium pullulans EXF-150]|uniref:Uncharacterized protein n=1 Tax=Aureobasidium pullulans EXF-150 TaxID=1043002 RepID=A0A074X854_AURPU|nr:uncharacterized protein M438DRAFT_337638 [Aureobasidium pullulans EXF-150]KEQ81660.1 hypothetical protein M438DRAFT_337638 [Aureobasidium pullulans EXF-150]